jgi:hypothetical protein
VFEEKSAPPMREARVAALAPFPWALRMPKSIIVWRQPDSLMRQALVATNV